VPLSITTAGRVIASELGMTRHAFERTRSCVARRRAAV